MDADIQLKILDPRIAGEWGLPQYATPASAAVDLRAAIDDTLNLEPGQAVLIPTGISIHVGNPHMCAVILPRSGLGHKHGIVCGNGTGLIDADYQGPLMVSAFNRSDVAYKIEPGDRIAQLVVLPIVRARFEVVDEFEQSTRGAGGFGHTGTR